MGDSSNLVLPAKSLAMDYIHIFNLVHSVIEASIVLATCLNASLNL